MADQRSMSGQIMQSLDCDEKGPGQYIVGFMGGK